MAEFSRGAYPKAGRAELLGRAAGGPPWRRTFNQRLRLESYLSKGTGPWPTEGALPAYTSTGGTARNSSHSLPKVVKVLPLSIGKGEVSEN